LFKRYPTGRGCNTVKPRGLARPLSLIESLHNKGFPARRRFVPLPKIDQAYIRLCRPATFFMISV
jgi:hypothetical protein